ncbi:MAG: hypothetical protein RBT41_02185 [Clostridia bacterium]|nr:hypothetical protein [Clostridia bacterium]
MSGFIHPLKLVDVQADIVQNDDESGYLINDGKDTVYYKLTQPNYSLKFENMPISFINKPDRNNDIWIEPKEELQSLLAEDIFAQPASQGFSRRGNETKIELVYTIGSIDPEREYRSINPPPLELLEEIKDSLYNADLVIKN